MMVNINDFLKYLKKKIQASQDELRDYFSHFGHVKDARIITDPRGNSKGYIYYLFMFYKNQKIFNLKIYL